MYTKSLIIKNEKVSNADKKSGASNSYYQAFVLDDADNEQFALFTEHELSQAIKRGAKNPEDKGVSYSSRRRWWQF